MAELVNLRVEQKVHLLCKCHDFCMPLYSRRTKRKWFRLNENNLELNNVVKIHQSIEH
jgi:hypothetical protein